MLTDQEIEDIGEEHAPYVDHKFARAIESAACAERDALIAKKQARIDQLIQEVAAGADVEAKQRARIAELEAANQAFGKRQEWWNTRMLELEQELAEARKAMETQKDEWFSWEAKRRDLEKDAERYRWLRDTNMTRPDMTDGSRVILAPNEVTSIWYGLPEDQWEIFGGCLQCSKGEKFDAAIDAAIKEQT